ncbi:calcium-binding protein [Breoghania sp. JC706]|uniref:calcium-binding protein n=1 Tax=Breoghania sp. JC706 TaxID=3117732 RepID=UPI0030096924
MPTRTGTNNGETIDLRTETATPPSGWPEHQAWWTVYAEGGNDTVLGSAYNDWVEGGTGNDTLYGYDGNDMLDGEAGNDILYGGTGDDALYGGDGTDQLYGGSGDDWLTGGAGNDYMEGGTGDDTFVGGAGNDTMFGQTGDDTFFGDAGADIMDGGAGSDRLWGGAGNDQYQYNGQGFDYINDGVTNTGSARTDATEDTSDVLIVSYTDADLGYSQVGDDLWFFSWADYSDDSAVDNAVIIEDFFLGGHYVVEYLVTENGAGSTYDLTGLLAA